MRSGPLSDRQSCLAEAVAWCRLRLDMGRVGESLRSVDLRPALLGRADALSVLMSSFEAVAAAVDFVCEVRRRRLAALGVVVSEVAVGSGRVLVTDFFTDVCQAS